jgi:hypothetical protein
LARIPASHPRFSSMSSALDRAMTSPPPAARLASDQRVNGGLSFFTWIQSLSPDGKAVKLRGREWDRDQADTFQIFWFAITSFFFLETERWRTVRCMHGRLALPASSTRFSISGTISLFQPPFKERDENFLHLAPFASNMSPPGSEMHWYSQIATAALLPSANSFPSVRKRKQF